jgi:hypothetical protein
MGEDLPAPNAAGNRTFNSPLQAENLFCPRPFLLSCLSHVNVAVRILTVSSPSSLMVLANDSVGLELVRYEEGY